jgi:hypothetical protein
MENVKTRLKSHLTSLNLPVKLEKTSEYSLGNFIYPQYQKSLHVFTTQLQNVKTRLKSHQMSLHVFATQLQNIKMCLKVT